MSEIKEIFYNIFWQNKACQNLFLLSKEELLDTKAIIISEDKSRCISFPRIIISNVDKVGESHETIKIRNETTIIKSESNIKSKIEKYTPFFTDFFESKFGKPLEKIVNEFSENPIKLAKLVMRIIASSDQKKEVLIINELQRFGFIGQHINSFLEIEKFFDKEYFLKNVNEIFSEENMWNFLDFIKSLKDVYVFEAYKSYYMSNQILVNSLFDIDEFKDRLKLFSHLYESGIISPSREDSFVECINCSPGTYRGTFQLKVNPSKLNEFNCPICNKQLNFYVPYELHNEIYEVIKSKDGLLLDALCDLLSRNIIKHKINQAFLDNIEIDCLFNFDQKTIYIVECKMYKINTTTQKLKNKMKEHYGKLIQDVDRLKREQFKDGLLIPILLVNITHPDLVNDVKNELKIEENNNANIYTINDMRNLIKIFKKFNNE